MLMLFRAFNSFRRIDWLRFGKQGTRSSRLARCAVAQIGMPYLRVKSDWWYIKAEQHHGFSVQLEVVPVKHYVVCVASAGITVDPEWISRRLAMTLLELNGDYTYGAFRLHDAPHGMSSLVIGHLCDAESFSASKIAEVGRALIGQMQSAVVRLYAEDLIIPPSA